VIADDFELPPTGDDAVIEMVMDNAEAYADGIGARGDRFRTILRVFRLAAEDVTSGPDGWDLNTVYTRIRAVWANRPELPAVPR
jgi:hypothetical protein